MQGDSPCLIFLALPVQESLNANGQSNEGDAAAKVKSKGWFQCNAVVQEKGIPKGAAKPGGTGGAVESVQIRAGKVQISL